MSRTSKARPSPAKRRAKEAPGTKPPVKRDADEVLSAPLRPTHQHLSAPPKWLGLNKSYLVEGTPAASTVKPVNTGTGAPSKGNGGK